MLREWVKYKYLFLIDFPKKEGSQFVAIFVQCMFSHNFTIYEPIWKILFPFSKVCFQFGPIYICDDLMMMIVGNRLEHFCFHL